MAELLLLIITKTGNVDGWNHHGELGSHHHHHHPHHHYQDGRASTVDGGDHHREPGAKEEDEAKDKRMLRVAGDDVDE